MPHDNVLVRFTRTALLPNKNYDICTGVDAIQGWKWTKGKREEWRSCPLVQSPSGRSFPMAYLRRGKLNWIPGCRFVQERATNRYKKAKQAFRYPNLDNVDRRIYSAVYWSTRFMPSQYRPFEQRRAWALLVQKLGQGSWSYSTHKSTYLTTSR